MKKLVVLTGAGISAESGIQTFRHDGGLWRQHRFEDLATSEAFARNPALVLDFYNERRKKVWEAIPNEGHLALVLLEKSFEVHIITQNVDDLHERAGSSRVLHLHGEIKKARSTADPDLILELQTWELNPGDLCPKGFQLRPHIVWFGEPVPMFESAINIASQADLFLVVGTSLMVYPAAGLIRYISPEIKKFYVDPNAYDLGGIRNLEVIREKACAGLPGLVQRLMAGKY